MGNLIPLRLQAQARVTFCNPRWEPSSICRLRLRLHHLSFPVLRPRHSARRRIPFAHHLSPASTTSNPTPPHCLHQPTSAMSLRSLDLARASRRLLVATRPFIPSALPRVALPRALPSTPASHYSTGPSRTYAALRQLHNSAPTARAPVPNPQSPLVPGRGSGPQSNSGSNTDGKKKNTQYGLWYGELFPGEYIQRGGRVHGFSFRTS